MDDKSFQTLARPSVAPSPFGIIVKIERMVADPVTGGVTETSTEGCVIKRDLTSPCLDTSPSPDTCMYEIHNSPGTQTLPSEDNKDQLASLLTRDNVSERHARDITDTVDNLWQGLDSLEEARYRYYNRLMTLEHDGNDSWRQFLTNSIKKERPTVPTPPPLCHDKTPSPFQTDSTPCDTISVVNSKCDNMVDDSTAQSAQPIVIAPIVDYDEDTRFLPNEGAAGQNETGDPVDTSSGLQSTTDKDSTYCVHENSGGMVSVDRTEGNNIEVINVSVEQSESRVTNTTCVQETPPNVQCSSQVRSPFDHVTSLPSSDQGMTDMDTGVGESRSVNMDSLSTTDIPCLTDMVESDSSSVVSMETVEYGEPPSLGFIGESSDGANVNDEQCTHIPHSVNGEQCTHIPHSVNGEQCTHIPHSVNDEQCTPIPHSANGEQCTHIPHSVNGEQCTHIPHSVNDEQCTHIPHSVNDEQCTHIPHSVNGEQCTHIPNSVNDEQCTHIPHSVNGEQCTHIPDSDCLCNMCCYETHPDITTCEEQESSELCDETSQPGDCDHVTTSNLDNCVTHSVEETCDSQPQTMETPEQDIVSTATTNFCQITVNTEQSSPQSVLKSDVGNGCEFKLQSPKECSSGEAIDLTTPPPSESERLEPGKHEVVKASPSSPLANRDLFSPKNDCSTCSGNYITEVTSAKMTKLKEHVFAVHFPWYLALALKKHSVKQRTTLSERLHPAFLCAFDRKWAEVPPIFIHMWGKLVHGLLQYLSTLLSIEETHDLLKYVEDKQLFPPKSYLIEQGVNVPRGERLLFKAHVTFLESANRHIGFSPPNCLSALLHWVTLANILCTLPESKRIAIVTYERYTTDNLYQNPAPARTRPSHSEQAAVLWRSIELNDVTKALEVIAGEPVLLKMLNLESGFGPVNQALSKKQYVMVTTFLLAGSDVDEVDRKGWTPLCRAAFRGDQRAVQILLAWGATTQLDKALKIAEGEKYTAISTAIAKCLEAKMEITRPKRETSDITVHEHMNDDNGQKADFKVPLTTKTAGAATDMTAVKCLLCTTVHGDDVELRRHFTLHHLPWYFRVAAEDGEKTDMEIKLRPVLKSYVQCGQVPFDYFAKLWGCLSHGFLRHLIELIDLPATEDLMRYVTKNSPVDATHDTVCMEEVILMRSHQMFYTGKARKALTLCPPSCLSALLHWRTLMNLISRLSDQHKRDVCSYDYHGDLTGLISKTQHTNCSKNSIPITDAHKQEFWEAIGAEDLRTIWKHIIDNKDIVNEAHDHKIFRNPLQFAVSGGHLQAAHLLLFNDVLVGRQDREGLTPLCRASKEGNMNGIRALLPWDTKDQLLNAIDMAEGQGHNVIVCNIKDHIKLVEKIATDAYRKLEVKPEGLNSQDKFSSTKFPVNPQTAKSELKSRKADNKSKLSKRIQKELPYLEKLSPPKPTELRDLAKDLVQDRGTCDNRPGLETSPNTSQGSVAMVPVPYHFTPLVRPVWGIAHPVPPFTPHISYPAITNTGMVYYPGIAPVFYAQPSCDPRPGSVSYTGAAPATQPPTTDQVPPQICASSQSTPSTEPLRTVDVISTDIKNNPSSRGVESATEGHKPVKEISGKSDKDWNANHVQTKLDTSNHDAREKINETPVPSQVKTKPKVQSTTEIVADLTQSVPVSELTTAVCGVCKTNVPMKSYKEHCMKNHLPWYIGVACGIYPAHNTKLASKIIHILMASLKKKQPLYCITKIWGALLSELLTFFADALELSGHSQLLKYVCEKSLCARRHVPEFIPSTGELQLVYEYQMTAYGKRQSVQFSPPNHESAVLHWKTLMNVIAILPKETQQMVRNYESSTWQDSLSGPRSHDTSTSHVPEDKVLQFTNCIATVSIRKLLSLLNEYPQLVNKSVGPHGSGVVTSALLGDTTGGRPGVNGLPGDVHTSATLLLLHGAPIDHQDDEGCTAVHRAVLANNPEVLQFLITWDADLNIENNAGDTANALAQANKYWVICDTLACATRPQSLRDKVRTSTEQSQPSGQTDQVDGCDCPQAPSPVALEDQYGTFSDGTFLGISHKDSKQDIIKQDVKPKKNLKSVRSCGRSVSTDSGCVTDGEHKHVTTSTSSETGRTTAVKRTCIEGVGSGRCTTTVPVKNDKTALDQVKKSFTHRSKIDTKTDAIEPSKGKASSKQMACPLCNLRFKRKGLKFHVCIEHLPWYIGLKFSTRGKTKPTQLAKRLMPVYSKVFDPNTKCSIHPVFDLGLGKLLNGLLKKFAEALGLDHLEDLVHLVNVSHLNPTWVKYEELRVDEVMLIRSHRSYIQKSETPSKKGVSMRPVSCVSAVLHWYTLACLLARLPAEMREGMKSYERYSSHELVELVPRPYPNIDTSEVAVLNGQFHCSIIFSDTDKVWKILSEQPEVANIRFLDECGTTPLQLALDNSRYVIATLLLLCGASVDQTNRWGHTALKVMSQRNNLEAVQFLLNWKPKAQIKECYEAALQVGHTNMCRTLRRALSGQSRCRNVAAGDSRASCNGSSPDNKLRSRSSSHSCPSSSEGDRPSEDIPNTQSSSSDKHPSQSRKIAGLHRDVKNTGLEITITKEESETRTVADRQQSEIKRGPNEPMIDSKVPRKRKATTKAHGDDDESMLGTNDLTGQPKRTKLEPNLCPLCNSRVANGKTHYLQCHLPWYVCLCRTTEFLLTGPRKTGLCSAVTSAMWSGPDQSNTACFSELIGQLLDGLLLFICKELNVKKREDLLQFATASAASSSCGRHIQFDELETMNLHQAWVKDSTVKLSLYPPNCTSVLLHPHWLVFLLSKLPRESQTIAITLERYSIPISKPVIDFAPKSPPEIKALQRRLWKSICVSALKHIAVTLQQIPSLVQERLQHSGNCGPVQFALAHKQYCVPVLLYLYGADVDQSDGNGFTPLHRAAMSGDLKAVKILLELGAKTGIRTSSGMEALDIATQQGHVDIAAALCSYTGK